MHSGICCKNDYWYFYSMPASLMPCGSSFGENPGTILEISTALASQIQRRNANARTMIARSKLYVLPKGNGLGFKPSWDMQTRPDVKENGRTGTSRGSG
jgi:hypothetical protein